MKKNVLGWIMIGTIALGFGIGSAQTGMSSQTALSVDAKSAVLEALSGSNGEYAAYATYSAVVDKFGTIQPYTAIRTAESRHIAALQRILTRYGEAIPANTYLGKIKLGDDLVTIAKNEAQTERDNVKMYDKLLISVKNYPDVTRVFTNLRSASLNQHLPAFEAAAKNGGKLETAYGLGQNRATMGGRGSAQAPNGIIGNGFGRGGRGTGNGSVPMGGGSGCPMGGPRR